MFSGYRNKKADLSWLELRWIADMIKINERLTRLYLDVIRLWTFYTPGIILSRYLLEHGVSQKIPLSGCVICNHENLFFIDLNPSRL